MLSKRKVGVILVTAVMVGCAVVAPVAAAKKKSHYYIQSLGVEAGYYGSTLENRAYVNMMNGDYNYHYDLALQDRNGTNRGCKSGNVTTKNSSKKLTSCWVDRYYGTNGAGTLNAYEY